MRAPGAEHITDERTGHQMQVGALTEGPNPLWGFFCITCDRFFAQRMSTIPEDQLLVAAKKFDAAHQAFAEGNK